MLQAHQDKKVAQMKEQIKAPEKIQLSSEEIANIIRCTVQNTDNQDAPKKLSMVAKYRKSKGYEK